MASAGDVNADVFHWITEYIAGAPNADMRKYGSALVNHADPAVSKRYCWLIAHYIRLGRMHRARVLDIGCGFGWHSAAISIMGENHVVANDIRPLMTDTLAARVADLKSRGAPLHVEPLTGVICSLDIAPAAFDAVFCNETIEHVHDLDAMFAQCQRVLRIGGRCVIVNDNNALNRGQMEKFSRMWQDRDRS